MNGSAHCSQITFLLHMASMLYRGEERHSLVAEPPRRRLDRHTSVWYASVPATSICLEDPLKKIVTLEVVARNGEIIDLELFDDSAVHLYHELVRILPSLFGPGYVVSLIRPDPKPREPDDPLK